MCGSLLVKNFRISESYFSFRGAALIFFLMLSFSIPESFGETYEILSKDIACLPKMKPDDFRYFSFTTFTTLGYGDYTPIGKCKEIAMTEAMIGLTVMPVLVAVSLNTLSSKS